VLPELYFTYRDMEERLRRLGQLIRQASQSESKVPEAQVTKWTSDYAKVDSDLSAISKAAKECLKAEESCDLKWAAVFDRIQFPQPSCAKVWFPNSESGEAYVVSFRLTSADRSYLGAQAANGSFTLQEEDAQINGIRYWQNGVAGCGQSFNPDGGYAAKVDLPNARTFNWYRTWNGTPCLEGYDVFFSLPRTVCTESVPMQQILSSSTSGRALVSSKALTPKKAANKKKQNDR
jgi:hypothetical protein